MHVSHYKRRWTAFGHWKINVLKLEHGSTPVNERARSLVYGQIRVCFSHFLNDQNVALPASLVSVSLSLFAGELKYENMYTHHVTFFSITRFRVLCN